MRADWVRVVPLALFAYGTALSSACESPPSDRDGRTEQAAVDAPASPQPQKSLSANTAAALAFLAAARHADGGVYDARDPLWAAWESIQAAHAHALWRGAGQPELVRGVLGFVERSAREHPHGMLYHSGGVPNRYCAETSSEYIRLLALAGEPAERARAKELAAWLATQQQANGSWVVGYEPPEGGPADFPSVTAFVVLALHAAGEPIPHASEARRFLEAAQHADGHFGSIWHVYGTHHYALAHVLPALRLLGVDANGTSLGAAQRYLRGSQRPDGSWWDVLGGHPREQYTSAELHTALALQACVWSGMATDDPTLVRGQAWLAQQQRADGSWFGGMFPFRGPSATTSNHQLRLKPEDLFATTQALTALHLIEQRKAGPLAEPRAPARD